jgi:hypothetical protein
MPVTRSNREAGRTAVTPSSSSNNRDPRPSIKTQDLGVGCIVWLPSKRNDDKSIKSIREFCCTNRELQESGYNHPVATSVREPTYNSHKPCPNCSNLRTGHLDPKGFQNLTSWHMVTSLIEVASQTSCCAGRET